MGRKSKENRDGGGKVGRTKLGLGKVKEKKLGKSK
jgi:hypothetical protein